MYTIHTKFRRAGNPISPTRRGSKLYGLPCQYPVCKSCLRLRASADFLATGQLNSSSVNIMSGMPPRIENLLPLSGHTNEPSNTCTSNNALCKALKKASSSPNVVE
ncbi:hypothetical protein NGA_2118800 [Nannochloropsis gaditana CCMP526]|uniref:uncharacterized protein n=1 Tax=Nannochloropsis gaditana (strain CCMP526) TaxID=1093141 RepID=UPI00029F590E|nr:hypothetical protein NGA_2118800 [Nannochloropsis gaditana CCMP526]EKU21136.1 hypothetical protein NGA_2118800 [Nannochloropsis gaditana CCMP526]|eukprot:XP_005855224.1 hypothetical protein NGA_2118800 [Nannochloropsis gaditana CCMP526]